MEKRPTSRLVSAAMSGGATNRIVFGLGLIAAACGKDAAAPGQVPDAAEPGSDGSGDDDATAATPQRPPRGQAAIETWLAEGWFHSWRCETEISPPRLTGNHGRHRICSNDLLHDSGAGTYPVGAASVKELFSAGDQPNGFAVGLKVEAGAGAQTWYWYERRGTVPTARPQAQGIAVPDCAVCHGVAPRDNVYFQAP
jgi:hypothetical protein